MSIWAIQGDEHLRINQLSSRLTNYNDALFTKLEYIYKYCIDHNITQLIKLGDTNTSLNTDLTSVVMNRYILLSKKYEKLKKWTILGNHDMYECNQDNLYKTSMLTLALAGAFDLILQPRRFENIQIQVLNVQIEKSIEILNSMQESDVPTVILGHHLFEWKLNMDCGLTRKHFEKFAQWKHPVTVFLGDDHTQYDALNLPNVAIYRLGSIMRTEKPSEDVPWQPRIALFNTETLEVKYEYIPCESYEKAFGIPKTKMNFTKLADLSKLENSFKKIGTIDYSNLRPSVVLEKMNCPSNYMEYLRNLHISQGENF